MLYIINVKLNDIFYSAYVHETTSRLRYRTSQTPLMPHLSHH